MPPPTTSPLAAFTAAILNNQPMGFYQPFTLIKDAQRHGLKVLPIDITCSDWLCTIEKQADEIAALRRDIAEIKAALPQVTRAAARQ